MEFLILYYVYRVVTEQKARAVYENIIDLTDDPDVLRPLLWLRQREIVHYNRFKELFNYYQKMFNKKQDMVDNQMSNNMSNVNNMMNNPLDNFIVDVNEAILRD